MGVLGREMKELRNGGVEECREVEEGGEVEKLRS